MENTLGMCLTKVGFCAETHVRAKVVKGWGSVYGFLVSGMEEREPHIAITVPTDPMSGSCGADGAWHCLEVPSTGLLTTKARSHWADHEASPLRYRRYEVLPSAAFIKCRTPSAPAFAPAFVRS